MIFFVLLPQALVPIASLNFNVLRLVCFDPHNICDVFPITIVSLITLVTHALLQLRLS